MTSKHNIKTLALFYILVLSIGTILSLYIPKNEVTASEAVIIPKEAIRLRILANSDLDADQAIKRLVRDEVNANITLWVQNLTSLDDARNLIQSKLPEIEKIATDVVKREGSDQSVNIEFGKVQFPTKLYGQFLYPAGEYEAILITLGEGKGANWWCVLFPPLCFLDFSNGVAVSDGFEDQEIPTKAKEQVGKMDQQIATNERVVQQQQTETTITKVQTETNPSNDQAENTNQVRTVNKPQKEQTEEPVYVAEAEEKVEVKFFLKELWMKFF